MTYFSSPFRDCTLLLLLACSLLAAPSCYGAERVALVIGNGEYQASPLKNPVNDANDITEMLSQLNFDVITRINANKKQMISAIDTFARKLRQADIGLFFYAGHGMQIRGQNYLIPVSVNVSSESDVEF